MEWKDFYDRMISWAKAEFGVRSTGFSTRGPRWPKAHPTARLAVEEFEPRILLNGTAVPFFDQFNANPPSQHVSPSWNDPNSNFSVATNAMVEVNAAASLATVRGLALTNTTVQADIVLGRSQQAGLIARYQSNGSYYLAMLAANSTGTSSTAYLYKFITGTGFVSIGNSVTLPSVAGRLRFEVVGTELKLFFGATSGTPSLVNYAYDSTITAAGTTGVRSSKNAILDNFFTDQVTLTTPSPLPFRDSFTQPNGSQLSRYWDEHQGNVSVVNNMLRANGSVSLATVHGLALTNTTVQADIVLGRSQQAGLIARYQSNGSYYLAMLAANSTGTSSTAYLYKFITGTGFMSLGTPVAVPAVAGKMRLDLVGSSLKLSLNNLQLMTASDSQITVAGTVGLRGTAGTTFDNFSGGAKDVAPTVTSAKSTVTIFSGQTATNSGTYFDPDATDVDTLIASTGIVTKTGTNNGSWNWSLNNPVQGQVVTITADDGRGGIATTAFTVFIKSRDTAPPVIGAFPQGISGTNGWYTSAVTINLSAYDAESGVVGTWYSVDSGQSWSQGTSFTIVADGATNVYFFSTDNSGNVENVHSLPIKIDKTPPTITGTPNRAANASGWYNADVTITFTATDNLSGVASSSGPVTLREGANQSAIGSAIDKAGNPAVTTVNGINIDKTLPTVIITSAPQTVANSTSANFSFAGSDPFTSGVSSGIDHFEYWVDGGAHVVVNGNAGNVTVSNLSDGFHTFFVTIFDKAGNSSTVSDSWIIDTTPPMLAADNSVATVFPGQVATSTGTYSDPDASKVVTLSASVGTIAANSNGTWGWSLNNPVQGQVVTITADDGRGGIATTTFSLFVYDMTPDQFAQQTAQIDAQQPITTSGYPVDWSTYHLGNNNPHTNSSIRDTITIAGGS